MTNGEKIKEIFPSFDVEVKTEYFGRVRNLDDHIIKADIEWWNSEYKEPTTKNDLGVDCISRQEVLRLLANSIGKTNTYLQTEVLRMPSVTPQEPKIGHWIVQPSNKEQGERDFIWWKCSECGQVIYSETEKDRKEFHAFCDRCGAKMVEPQESEDKE